MKTACGYIRVSTDYQTEYSPDAQKELIFKYCREHDISISNCDIFSDIGISGTKTEIRPNFNRMIAACKDESHPYDMILVWKFSRFARNQEESILYKRLLRKNNVEVISISEPIPEGFVGELIERIFEWMDEYYSINLSQEVKRGMRQRATEGKIVGKVPYGYDHVKGENPTINESEAKVIRMMFDMYLNGGYGIHSLTRWMNENGFRTKSGAMWNRNKVSYILSNPFYCGKIRWDKKSEYMNTGGKYTPKGDWVMVDGQHEPIISEETYQQVQEKLEKNHPHIPQNAPRKHYLSGVFKCASCGGSLNYSRARVSKQNKHIKDYFYCRYHNQGKCDNINRTGAAELEEYFIEGLRNVIETGNYTLVQDEKMDDLRVQSIRDQIDKVHTKEKRIKDAYINGIDSLEEYNANKTALSKELEELEASLSKLSNGAETSPNPPTKSQIEDVISILQSDDYSVEQKNEAVLSIVDKVVYDRNQKTMEFYLHSL